MGIGEVRKWVPRVVLLVGLGSVGVGAGSLLGVGDKSEEVVIIEPEPGITKEKILGDKSLEEVVVDVAGAVNKPGVFRVSSEARVAEVLMLAEGLVEEADEAYVAREINQAQQVKDGMKIYVPFAGEVIGELEEKTSNTSVSDGEAVNVNTASLNELESLRGVGEVRAKAIMDHRPYNSLTELKDKAGLPQNVITENEGRIIF